MELHQGVNEEKKLGSLHLSTVCMHKEKVVRENRNEVVTHSPFSTQSQIYWNYQENQERCSLRSSRILYFLQHRQHCEGDRGLLTKECEGEVGAWQYSDCLFYSPFWFRRQWRAPLRTTTIHILSEYYDTFYLQGRIVGLPRFHYSML